MTKNVFEYSGGSFRLVPVGIIFELRDALNTPKGSVFGDPAYGSNRPRLIDAPVNESFKIKAYRETVAVIRERFKGVELDRMEIIDGGTAKAMVRCYFKNGETVDV